jgi:Flp pilus assembly protein protease CpaA
VFAGAVLGGVMGLLGTLAARVECPKERIRVPAWAAALGCAAVLGLLAGVKGWPHPVRSLTLVSLASAVGAADAHRRVVPDSVSLAGLLVGVALWAVDGRPLEALVGAAAASLPFVPGAVTGKMGGGDVKAAAALGAIAGWPLALRGVALGALLGGGASLLVIISSVVRRSGGDWRRMMVPYAVFLAGGFALAAFI